MILKTILQQTKDKLIDGNQGVALIEKIKLYSQDNSSNEEAKTYTYGEAFVAGHQVFNKQVLLGTTYISMAIKSFYSQVANKPLRLCKVIFIKPVVLDADKPEVQLKSKFKLDREAFKFEVGYHFLNQTNGSNEISCKGEIDLLEKEAYRVDLPDLKTKLVSQLSTSSIYDNLNNINYLESMRTIDEVFIGENFTLSKLSVKDEITTSTDKFELHPNIIDGAILSVLSKLAKGNTQDAFIPLYINAINLYKKVPSSCFCLGRVIKTTDELLVIDFELIDDDGTVLAEFEGVSCKKIADVSLIINNEGDTAKTKKDIKSSTINRTASGLSNRGLSSETKDNKENIQNYIILKLQEFLGSDKEIAIEVNYMDLGLESSMLIEMAQTIESELNIELYPTLFFEYQCVKDLTNYFNDNYLKEFTVLFGEPEEEVTKKMEEEVNFHRHDTAYYSEMEKQLPDTNAIKTSSNEVRTKDIAIIGMGGMFPKSNSIEEFWSHLEKGSDLISEIPLSRFDYKPWYDAEGEKTNSLYCKWGSFINDIDKFDEDFFNFSDREADMTDPQLRHLLQVTYQTIDDAGYINKIKGTNTGMYVGACFHDYQTQMISENKEVDPYDGIGNSATMLANRPSFFFDLKGPSFTVDTACSSSLVALHLACKALQNGECDMAFASGVNLLLTPGHYIYFSTIGALSKTGRCHTFDEKADGYVPGEGIVSVLLKPLNKAIEDGDQIHGVIKGSAVKHSGYSSTITAPNITGEVDVMVESWKDAQINPRDISYIECHGTGTKLGDPIEIQAIKTAFNKFTSEPSFCAVGSAKAHIGHLEGAAGIAGIIKVVLSMKNKKIPKMPNYQALNPFAKITDRDAIYINEATMDWKTENVPMIAGVNSFGYGGAFAHVVLQEAPNIEIDYNYKVDGNQSFIIPLSAKSPFDLSQLIQNMIEFLEIKMNDPEVVKNPEAYLEQLAYTLQVGRKHYNYRYGLIVNSLGGILNGLRDKNNDNKNSFDNNVTNYEDITSIFHKDLALKSALDNFASQSYTPTTILKLWNKGFEFNWSNIYDTYNKPKVTSLISYPFKKNLHWYKERNQLEDIISPLIKEMKKYDANYPLDNLSIMKKGFGELEMLCVKILCYKLSKTDFFSCLTVPIFLNDIVTSFEITFKYKFFLKQLLTVLVNDGIVKEENNYYSLIKKPSIKVNQLNKSISTFKKEYPELKAYLSLLEITLENMVSILKEEKHVNEILFEPEAAKIIESIYKSNPIADYFNDKISHFVSEFLQNNFDTTKKLVILEIGAGFGGTTASVLPVINAYKGDKVYHYTDISPSFESHALKFSEKFNFIEFSTLDVEDLTSKRMIQDFNADIIIASNVLHATKDIRNTIRNAASLANPNGVIIINELTEYQNFLTFTFGLFDGWWLFDDNELRIEGSPLICKENWKKILEEIPEFHFQQYLPQQIEGQHVFVALKGIGEEKAPLEEVLQLKRSTDSIIEKPLELIEKDIASKSLNSGIQQHLKDLVFKVAKTPIDEITGDQNFLELGIDSIKGIEFLRMIQKKFTINIGSGDLFNNPTLDQLSNFISRKIKIDNNRGNYDRFFTDPKLSNVLKEENNLGGKMDVYKLFEKIDVKKTESTEAIETVYQNDVNIEYINLENDITLEIIRKGNSGEVILLCSPLNSLATVWQHQVKELSSEFQLVVVHYPGYGNSEMLTSNFSIEDLGRMIVSVMKTLNLSDTFHIVGWSMGGLIAQSIAENVPNLVRSVVLLGTGTISMFDDDYSNEHTHVKEVITQEAVKAGSDAKMIMDNEFLLIGTYNTNVLLQYAKIIKEFDHKCKRNVECEILIVQGELDKVLERKYAKALLNNFKKADYLEIVNAGHFLALTHFKELNAILKTFIKKQNVIEQPSHYLSKESID
jgi:3-oxoacyl-(acyl-carrier-protein) synthase/pimeloyl-ACP methyl ester carboxylesterase/acyl carrier protein/2-polyprenyl-3-methyl-5-hydroxy-6-metoxy-1,4-benzoquinol methylase